jgi:hypothetical protein
MDASMCSNDDKSCYDRILHAITYILMQHQNVPASSCICVFTTLQNLHHTLMTIYGDSKSGYGGTLWAVPYSGIGQGNGTGPAMWAVVSTPVLKMMKDEGFGFYPGCTMGMNQKAMQPTSGKSNQDHQKGHGRYGRSTWGSW